MGRGKRDDWKKGEEEKEQGVLMCRGRGNLNAPMIRVIILLAC